MCFEEFVNVEVGIFCKSLRGISMCLVCLLVWLVVVWERVWCVFKLMVLVINIWFCMSLVVVWGFFFFLDILVFNLRLRVFFIWLVVIVVMFLLGLECVDFMFFVFKVVVLVVVSMILYVDFWKLFFVYLKINMMNNRVFIDMFFLVRKILNLK